MNKKIKFTKKTIELVKEAHNQYWRVNQITEEEAEALLYEYYEHIKEKYSEISAEYNCRTRKTEKERMLFVIDILRYDYDKLLSKIYNK